jgi:hypothetical protein
VAVNDPFLTKMLECSRAVHVYGLKQPLCFQVNRSDYIIDGPTGLPQQVEMNTISSSFITLSPKIQAFHQYLEANYSSKHASDV